MSEQKKVYAAFIGTSQEQKWKALPRGHRELYLKAVGKFVTTQQKKGNLPVVVSGGATCADRYALELALRLGAHIKVYLGWATHNSDWIMKVNRLHPGQVETVVFKEADHALWEASVTQYHPLYGEKPERMSWAVKRLMARNFPIIMGELGEGEATVVVALPFGGPTGGGTGQGVRIARDKKVRLYNLALPKASKAKGREQEFGRAEMLAAVGDYQLPQFPAPELKQGEEPQVPVQPNAEGVLRIDLWVDGSCIDRKKGKAKPGHLGAGVVAVCGPNRKEWAIPAGQGTSQLAELKAVYEGLKRVKHPTLSVVTVHTDSKYVINMLAGGYTAHANKHLIEDLKKQLAGFKQVRFQKVAGHSGNELNEAAHVLATQAAEAEKLQWDTAHAQLALFDA